MNNEKKQEFTRRISQANTTEMVVIIYDIALTYLDEMTEAIGSDDKQNLKRACVNVRHCINELIGSLNYEYSPAGELLQIYIYCSKLLVKVDSKKDEEALLQIKSIITRLRDAYSQVIGANTGGPVMANSESVYAGLTYGRGSLNEDVVSSSNRGFLA